MTDKELIMRLNNALRTLVYQDPCMVWRSGFLSDSDVSDVVGEVLQIVDDWEDALDD